MSIPDLNSLLLSPLDISSSLSPKRKREESQEDPNVKVAKAVSFLQSDEYYALFQKTVVKKY